MTRWLLAAAALVVAGVAAADGVARWELAGWGASIAVRPEHQSNAACYAAGDPHACCTGSGTGTCGYSTCTRHVSDATVAKARFVMVGTENSVPEGETLRGDQTWGLVPKRDNSTAAPTTNYDDNIASANTCWYPSATYRGQETHQNLATYVTAIRAAAAPGTVNVVLMARSDLVAFPQAQIAGLTCDMFVSTTTPWATFQAAVTADTSTGSAGQWSDSYNGSNSSFRGKDVDCRDGTGGTQGCRLRDYLDRICGSANAYQGKTFYLTRGNGNEWLYPDAAVMRLDDADYRAWRVAYDQRELAATGADMIDHNHKFWQYLIAPSCTGSGTPYPCCTGSGAGAGCSSYFYDKNTGISAFNAASSDSVWTGDTHDSPESYGYQEYLAGWVALAAARKAAGVRYAVVANRNMWFGSGLGYDDPATGGTNENETIRGVLYDASAVLLDKVGTTPSELDSILADLDAHGVVVEVYDSRQRQYPRP